MRSQKEVWMAEHNGGGTFTRIHSEAPSGCVEKFAQFLEEQGLKPPKTRVLDLGCGKGRNSIYLAKKGFRVTGVDFVEEGCLTVARKRAEDAGLNINFEAIDATHKWHYPDNSFQAMIDTNTTICIPNPGRQKVIDEIYAKLDPKGYYLFYGVGTTELVRTNPGPEPNSCLFPRTGEFEKQYSKDELLRAYNKFKLINFEEPESRDVIEGKEMVLPMLIAIFQKPKQV